MGDLLRYLVSVDSANGAVVKVERLGEAGDLTDVDPAAFAFSLSPGPGGPVGATVPSPIVINIYAGGGVQGGTARTGRSGQPIVSVSGWEAGPPPTSPPPPRPKPGKKK